MGAGGRDCVAEGVVGIGPDAVGQEIAVGIVGEVQMVRMVGMVLMGWMVGVVGDGNVFVQLIRLELCPCVAETIGGEVADVVEFENPRCAARVATQEDWGAEPQSAIGLVVFAFHGAAGNTVGCFSSMPRSLRDCRTGMV